MKSLGSMKKIDDLRSVWQHEARDFSKWLAQDENLALLSSAIGIDIVLEELESPVGGFSVDLFGTEDGTDRKIIIENQLEETNHDHLGKIITYASGKDAEVVVWIVSHARDEHRQAVQWLNQHTDSDIGFFLIEIELLQIDDSPYAPRFNVVERPNDWEKQVKAEEGLSDTKKLQLEFWQAFSEYAQANKQFTHVFRLRKPLPQHWYDLALGTSSYHLSLTVNTQKKRVCAGIYINDDKPTYCKFEKNKEAIESMFGTQLEWIEASKSSRFTAVASGDIAKKETWPKLFDWLMASGLKMREIALTFDK